MQLKQVMTRGAKTVRGDAIVLEAAMRMRESGIGALPVTVDGALRGIVTDRDITVRAIATGLDPCSTAVQDIMTRDVVTCPAGSDVSDAMRLMNEKQVRRIVVTDTNSHPVGIVSLGDLAQRLHDEHLAAELLRGVSRPD